MEHPEEEGGSLNHAWTRKVVALRFSVASRIVTMEEKSSVLVACGGVVNQTQIASALEKARRHRFLYQKNFRDWQVVSDCLADCWDGASGDRYPRKGGGPTFLK